MKGRYDMGYTTYFGMKKEIKSFDKTVIQRIKEVAEKYKELIQFEGDNNEPPQITEKAIRFNGIGDEAYETFMIDTTIMPNFCKTGRMPYDIVVCEMTLIFKDFYGDDFKLSSDGFCVGKQELENFKFDGVWNEAIENVKKDYGIELEFERITEKSGGREYYHFSLVDE